MNRIMRALSLFIAVSMCFFTVESCNEVTVSPLNLYDSYYPISIGEERIYTVDSIAFDNFNNRIDTFYYRQREVIVDTFRNSQQNLMFLGQIFKEDTAGNIWNNNGTFFVEKTKDRVIRTQNNKQTIVLVFPLIEEKIWSGNALNNDEQWTFQVIDIHKSRKVFESIYDSTAFIKHIDVKNFVQRKLSTEIYAINTGLLFKETIFTNTQNQVIGGTQLIFRLQTYIK